MKLWHKREEMVAIIRPNMPAWWNGRKILRAAITLLVLAVVLTLLLTCSRFIMPFLLAGVIMLVLEPAVSFFEKKLHLPRFLSSIITIVLFMALAGTLLVWLTMTMVSELLTMVRNLPPASEITSYFTKLLDIGRYYFESIPPDIMATIEGTLQSSIGQMAAGINTGLTRLVTLTLNGLRSTVTQLPTFFIVFAVTMVSTFFMSRDRVLISRFFERQLPQNGRETFKKLKSGMFAAIIGVLRAQVVLSLINGCIAFLGYTIAGVRFPLLAALITAVVDVLPVVGAGSVLVPWAAISFFTNDPRTGIILGLTYIVIFMARQFIEPRLMGKGLGLHPLVTLMSMYVGLRAGGVLGLFMLPLLVTFLKALQEADLLPRFSAEK